MALETSRMILELKQINMLALNVQLVQAWTRSNGVSESANVQLCTDGFWTTSCIRVNGDSVCRGIQAL